MNRDEEVEGLKKQLSEARGTFQGHKQLCYYCGKACNALHANPGLWPIPLCHADDPGKVKWHHVGCISERLLRLEELEKMPQYTSFHWYTNASQAE